MTNVSSWLIFLPFGIGIITGFIAGAYWRGLEEKESESEKSLNSKIIKYMENKL